MNKLLQGIAILGLGLGSIMLRLFVIVKVWGYIAVPMGAPPVNNLQAYGLTVLASLLYSNYQKTPNTSKKRTVEESFTTLLTHLLRTLISWGVAYWIFG